MKDRIIHQIVKWLILNQKKAFLFILLLPLALLPSLNLIQSDFTFEAFYKKNDPHLLEYKEFEKTFGNDDRIILVVKFNSPFYEKKNIRKIKELEELLLKTPSVIGVNSILNYKFIDFNENEVSFNTYFSDKLKISQNKLRRLKDNEKIKNYLLGKNFQTIALYGQLKPFYDTKPDYITPVQFLKNKLKNDKNIKVAITGTAPIMESLSKKTKEDFKLILSLVSIVLFILCFFLFRSMKVIFSLLFVVFVTIILTLEISVLLGITLTATTVMIPQVVLAICILDAIHILTTYQKTNAIEVTLQKNFVPTLLTSLTTAIGFFSLTTSDLKPISNLGLSCGLGALVAWGVSYLSFPFIMSKIDHLKKVNKPKDHALNFISFLNRHTKIIFISIVSLFVVSSYYASNVNFNSDTIKIFHQESKVRKDYEFALKHLGGVKGIELIAKNKNVLNLDHLIKVRNFRKKLLKQSYITHVFSIDHMFFNLLAHFDKEKTNYSNKKIEDIKTMLELGSSGSQGLYQWINISKTKLRLSLLWTLSSSKETLSALAEIKNMAKNEGLNIKITGKTPMVVSSHNYLIKSFFTSIILTLILLAIIMGFVFKSWTIAVMGLIPNVFPIIIVGAFCYGLGLTINLGTVLVGSVCLGIAIDDTIHFFYQYYRLREERLSIQEKLRYVVEHIGRPLVNTTLILVACFSTFSFGQIKMNAEFGLLVALVLIFALISDLIIIPIFLILLDRLNKNSR